MAGYTLAMHVLDHYIITIPERCVSLYAMALKHVPGTESFATVTTSVPGAFWGDILAFVAIGSGFLFFYLRALTQTAALPSPRSRASSNPPTSRTDRLALGTSHLALSL